MVAVAVCVCVIVCLASLHWWQAVWQKSTTISKSELGMGDSGGR